MNSLQRPHHVGLQITDMELSLRFYRDLLGFDLLPLELERIIHSLDSRLSRRRPPHRGPAPAVLEYDLGTS